MAVERDPGTTGQGKRVMELLVQEEELHQSQIFRKMDLEYRKELSELLQELEQEGQIYWDMETQTVELVEKEELEPAPERESESMIEILANSDPDELLETGEELEVETGSFEETLEEYRVPGLEHEVDPAEVLDIRFFSRDSRDKYAKLAHELIEELEQDSGELGYDEVYARLNWERGRSQKAIYLLADEDVVRLTEDTVELPGMEEDGFRQLEENSNYRQVSRSRPDERGIDEHGNGYELAGRKADSGTLRQVARHLDGKVEPVELENAGISGYSEGSSYSMLTDTELSAIEVENPPEKEYVLYLETGSTVTPTVSRVEPVAYFDDIEELRGALEELDA